MKKIYAFLCVLMLYHSTNAQMQDRKLVSTAGTTLAANGYEISFSLGEPVVRTTFVATTNLQTFLTVGFQQPLVSSVGQIVHEDNWVSVYPNPATNRIRLDIHGHFPQSNFCKVVDAFGRTVLYIPSTFINGSMDIDISKLQTGIYYVTVTDPVSKNTVSGKFLKQNLQ